MADEVAPDVRETFQNHENDAEPVIPSGDGNNNNNKRKFEDAEPESAGAALPEMYSNVPPPVQDIDVQIQKAQELAAKFSADGEAKRSKLEEERSDPNPALINAGRVEMPPPATEEAPPGGEPSGLNGQQHEFNQYQQDGSSSTKKIDVPNSKVGLVIGKSGETIKYLQQQSGARIQVTRDADTDPRSQVRPVELMGTPEQISLAEKLINDVITEENQSRNGQAGTGGSGALLARGFGGLAPPGDSVIIKVPNNKVGLIIGRGGETIKNLQNRSGARIQVQSDREVEAGASERSVTLVGNKKATDMASELIAEVVDENRRGPPLQGGNFSGAGGFRGQSQWGPPPGPPMQQGYGGYQQPAYQGPPQQQYGTPPQQQYGAYAQQQPSGFQAGWDQRSAASSQVQQSAGYDYYGQQQSQSVTPQAPATAAPTDSSYSYGQQSQGYYGYQQPQAQTATAGYQGYGQQQQTYGQAGYAGQQQTQTQTQQQSQPAAAYNGYNYAQQATGTTDQATAAYSQQGYAQQPYAQTGYAQPSADAANASASAGAYDYSAAAQSAGGNAGQS